MSIAYDTVLYLMFILSLFIFSPANDQSHVIIFLDSSLFL